MSVKRNEYIVELYKSGKTLREVAKIVELSPTRIGQILRDDYPEYVPAQRIDSFKTSEARRARSLARYHATKTLKESPVTITELIKLRKKLMVNPVENREQLLWIRTKLKGLQSIERNKRMAAKPRLSLYDSKDADKVWAKAYEEGRL